MFKYSVYLSIFLLVFNLIACQSDTNEVTHNQSASSVPQMAKEASEVPKSKISVEDSLRLSEEKLQLEKEEKLSKLEVLKEKRDSIRLVEERAERHRKRDERKKIAEAKEALRLKEQKEQKKVSPKVKTLAEFEQERYSADSLKRANTPLGQLQFLERSHDFGKIKEGDTFEHEFKFYNPSEIPVVISDIKASCGCTKTTFPKEPIMPGESGAIGVTFDSKGKLGRQKPFMSVITNGNPSIYSLYMDGTVDTERE